MKIYKTVHYVIHWRGGFMNGSSYSGTGRQILKDLPGVEKEIATGKATIERR